MILGGTGLQDGERLDIDWDYFSSTEYAFESIPARIEAFWQSSSGVIPDEAYVCYSPEYSHPSRRLFAEFVQEMADRFGARVIALEPPVTESSSDRRAIRSYVPDTLFRHTRTAYHRASQALKQRGVF